MPSQIQDPLPVAEKAERQRKTLFLWGGIAALVVVIASLSDIVISMLLGGDLSAIPQTAIDRFAQFQSNWFVGLYYLDFLNLLTALIMIPVYLALFEANRQTNQVCAALSLLVFTIGTATFVTNNTALSMLSLSSQYAIETSESQKMLLAAAGEALLARGAHGSSGAFFGFLLPIVSSLIMSCVMLRDRIFSPITAWVGIAGSVLFTFYFVTLTFLPNGENLAMALAIPGGLLMICWMILFAVRLLKLRHSEERV